MKYLAHLANGMILGPLVKTDYLPCAPGAPGFIMELPLDRAGYRITPALFGTHTGDYACHALQWNVRGTQVDGAPGMRILKLVPLDASEASTLIF